MFDIKKAGRYIEEQVVIHPLFDHYRIVDIDTYTVHEWKEGTLVSKGDRCYQIWKRDHACQNCISRLAITEKRRIIKMEAVGGKIFLVNAIPLPELGPHLALELVSDVTNSLLINDDAHVENMMLTELIQQMNELATHDSYTGLYNKRFLEHELQRQTLEWEKTVPFVIVLLDIDWFKHVNDTYGHQMGDRVILMLADYLKTCAEKYGGWAGRVGGDEFILAFQGIHLEKVEQLIAQFRQIVSEIDFGEPEQSCFISISVGIAEFQPDLGDWRALFRLADQAMYRNKQCRKKKAL